MTRQSALVDTRNVQWRAEGNELSGPDRPLQSQIKIV